MLTFWDKRCTQHHAVWADYPMTRRGLACLDRRKPAKPPISTETRQDSNLKVRRWLAEIDR